MKYLLIFFLLSIFSFAYISAGDLSTTAMDSYKQAFIDIKDIKDKAVLDSISIKEISFKELKDLPKEIVIKEMKETTLKMYKIDYNGTRSVFVISNG